MPQLSNKRQVWDWAVGTFLWPTEVISAFLLWVRPIFAVTNRSPVQPWLRYTDTASGSCSAAVPWGSLIRTKVAYSIIPIQTGKGLWFWRAKTYSSCILLLRKRTLAVLIYLMFMSGLLTWPVQHTRKLLLVVLRHDSSLVFLYFLFIISSINPCPTNFPPSYLCRWWSVVMSSVDSEWERSSGMTS